MAREAGYLDATCPSNQAVVKAYTLWCWRLRLPALWFERRTPYSRCGRLRLDMFTTPNRLTPDGHAALEALCAGLGLRGETAVSPHGAAWDRVPRAGLAALAHAAFRTVLRVGNQQLNRPRLAPVAARRPLVRPFPPAELLAG